MSNLITVLTIEDFIPENSGLRNTGYIVTSHTKSTPQIQPDTFQRLDLFCLMLVQDGYYEYLANGHKYRITAGDILFSPRFETFTIHHVSTGYL